MQLKKIQKKINQLIFIIVITSLTACFGQEITIETDTLHISNHGWLREVAFFKDNLYLLFSTDRKNTTGTFKSMKIYDSNGKFIENVFLSKEAVSMFYCDLRVNDKRLYMVQEHAFEKQTFLLEKFVADFNKIPKKDINIYEDADFIIYPNCNGEWGASIYFKDKKDNKVYEFASSCNFNFLKVEQGYLLTNKHEILIIKDPTKLYQSKLTFDRSYLEKENQGVESFFKSEFELYKSFRMYDKLMVIYNDSKTTHIGELKNNTLTSVYRFKKPYSFSNWFTDNNNNSTILQMFTYESLDYFGYKGFEMKGVFLISDGKFKMYHLK
ncbi:hypothetical protein IMCC3317_33280 [Kordia antarctica]|uniref:Uncharacterized protein n=1 Tax=Kordia antarctica TaxID=1218801 RepID=A0A7L4ZMV9_9FLAO|nr:hypothetical protein [Kordia antarctica]QHI37945.1 hypothetical protein IMCC3317_33280 [Kordia antarctica]